MKTAEAEHLKGLIRDVPDFPKKGILFKDITTVLKDGPAFAGVVDAIVSEFRGRGISSVIAIEARGFVLGSAVAYALGCGLVPVRKKGKLPCKTHQVKYGLEYGEDCLEIHADALSKGEKVLVVDDLLATGGTMAAVVDLVERLGADIAGLAFFVELGFLNGRAKLASHPVFSILQL